MQPNDGGDYDPNDDDEENMIDNDDDDNEVASSDSELQVEDPSQSIKEGENQADQQQEDDDPMAEYYKQEDAVLEWLANHPGEKWTDPEFTCSYRQFFQD